MDTARGRPLDTPPDRTTGHAGPTSWLTTRPIALAMIWLLLAPLLVILPQPTADAIEDGPNDNPFDTSAALRYAADGTVPGSVIPGLVDEDDEALQAESDQYFPMNFFGEKYEALCFTTNGAIFPTPEAGDSCNDDYDRSLAVLALDANAPIIAPLAADQDLRRLVATNTAPGSLWAPQVESFATATTSTVTTATPHNLKAGHEVVITDHANDLAGEDYDTDELATVVVTNVASPTTFETVGDLSELTPEPSENHVRVVERYHEHHEISGGGGSLTLEYDGDAGAFDLVLGTGFDVRYQTGDLVTFAGTGTLLDDHHFEVTRIADRTFQLPAGDLTEVKAGVTGPVTVVEGWLLESDGVGAIATISHAFTQIDGRDAMVTTWYRVRMFRDDTPSSRFQTFQVVIVQRETPNGATDGFDFDIEFNYGTLTASENGYAADDPGSGCGSNEVEERQNCRYGKGWASYATASVETYQVDDGVATLTFTEEHGLAGAGTGIGLSLPSGELRELLGSDLIIAQRGSATTIAFSTSATDTVPTTPEPPVEVELSDAYELVADIPIDDLMDFGDNALIAGRLNTDIDGRYTFAMVGGVTEGFEAISDAPPAPAPSPSPSPAPSPQPVPEPVVPRVPGVGGGSIDGQETALQVRPVVVDDQDTTADPDADIGGQDPTGVEIAGEVDGNPFSIVLEPADEAGERGNGTVTGTQLRLTQGQGVRTRLSGFAPNTQARLSIFSEPRELGTFTTDGAGTLTAAVEMLPDDITACQHTLQVTGTLTGGQQATAELGVWVLANPFPYPDVATVSTHAPAIGCLTDLDGIIGFDGGDYHQQQPTTRGQAATILVRLLGLDPADPSFGDAGTTHAASIGALEAEGILNGHTDATVRPHTPLTRGQAASLLARAAGLDDDPDAAAGFTDTGTTHAGALGALLTADGLTGYPDNTLRPDQPITRGQYATMVVRLRNLLQPDPDNTD